MWESVQNIMLLDESWKLKSMSNLNVYHGEVIFFFSVGGVGIMYCDKTIIVIK